MDALKALGFALCLLGASASARADPVDRWAPYIAEASARFGVPAAWVARVMRAESGGHTELDGRPIISRAGAMGLMQLMPGTWTEMRRRLGLGHDPHRPRDNILAGTFYLRLMYDRFGYPGLFAAYNAGPARYAAVRAGRSTLPDETRSYLASVAGPDAGKIGEARGGISASATAPAAVVLDGDRPPARLFFALRATPAASGGEQYPQPGLFVALQGQQAR